MKKAEIQIGKSYVAKVSGVLAIVRIVGIREIPPASWSSTGSWRTIFDAVNVSTGRKVTIRSAARLRREADPPQKNESGQP